ncbi:helix-turn-helix domain-containing protein [Arthrobacter sp. R3-55]
MTEPIPRRQSRPLQYLKAVANSRLPTGARAVCWALASFADNTDGTAWPSLATLAKATGLSKPVISRHTVRAEAAGYLLKTVRKNNSIIYTITEPCSEAPPDHPTT